MATRGWFYKKKRSKDETYILLAGGVEVGKSTLIRKLNHFKMTWFGIERTALKKRNFSVWDLEEGGRTPVRPLMLLQCETVDVAIFVFDTKHFNGMFESTFGTRETLRGVQDCLAKEELKDCPLLVLANKQDLPGAMTCQELRDLLALSEDQDQRVEIIATSLVTGQGLPEVRDWIDRQHALRQLQRAVVQPLEKAVPPTLKSASSRMSSALKQAFGTAKNKLPSVA